ncbi:rhodopsin [Daphnia magna]|nr:rhodopsin [Daphnia magna]
MQRLRTPFHIDRLRFQNIVDIFSCLLFRLVRAIRRRYKSAIFVVIVMYRRSIQQKKKSSIIAMASVIKAGSVTLIVLMSFVLCVGSVNRKTSVTVSDYVPRQHLIIVTSSNISDGLMTVSGLQLMPTWAYKASAAYLFLISVLGLILNIIVIIVLLNDPKKMTPLNWMLLNLACSDGIIAGFGAPVSIVAALHSGWPFGKDLCTAYAMITSTAGIGSITTLSALAIFRCKLVVQKHLHPPNRVSAFTNRSVRLGQRQAALLLTSIWTYALAVTCPPLLGWGHYGREAAHISCSVNWELKMDGNRSYIFYMFAMGLFLPMVVIITSYSNILRVVRKVKREINQRSIMQIRVQPQKEKNRRSDAAEKRSTVMVAVMIGAFMVAWTPYSILALVEVFSGRRNDSVTSSPALATIPCLFAKTSAVLNPIIYGFLNTQFRSAWEKFSIRFLGRQGLVYNHGMVVGTSSNEQPRELLDMSAAGQLTKTMTQSLALPPERIEQTSLCRPREMIVNDAKESPIIVPERTIESNGLIAAGQEEPVSLEIVRFLNNSGVHRIQLLYVNNNKI